MVREKKGPAKENTVLEEKGQTEEPRSGMKLLLLVPTLKNLAHRAR